MSRSEWQFTVTSIACKVTNAMLRRSEDPSSWISSSFVLKPDTDSVDVVAPRLLVVAVKSRNANEPIWSTAMRQICRRLQKSSRKPLSVLV